MHALVFEGRGKKLDHALHRALGRATHFPLLALRCPAFRVLGIASRLPTLSWRPGRWRLPSVEQRTIEHAATEVAPCSFRAGQSATSCNSGSDCSLRSVLTLFGSAYYGLYAYRGLGEKPERPFRPNCRSPIGFATAWPRLHEILSQVEEQQRFDAIVSDELASASTTDQTVWDTDGMLRQKCRNQFEFFCQDAGTVSGQARHKPASHRFRHRGRHVRARDARKN